MNFHLQVTKSVAAFVAVGAVIFGAGSQPALANTGTDSGGWKLLPNATPLGYSLDQMASETALFNTSGNDLLNYPNTPFQLLYVDWSTASVETASDGGLRFTGGNHFTVRPGKFFYVPLWNFNDGGFNDGGITEAYGPYPTTRSDAATFFFGPEHLGGYDFKIFVDGRREDVSARYVSTPVVTPTLHNGATHIITLAAFLTPLTPGSHTVTITGGVSGQAIRDVEGVSYMHMNFTYYVDVIAP